MKLMSIALLALVACGTTADSTVTVLAKVREPGAACTFDLEEHELDAEYWSAYDVDRRGGECNETTLELVADDGTCWWFPNDCGIAALEDPMFRRDAGDPEIDTDACDGC